jgi:hypothetical protein
MPGNLRSTGIRLLFSGGHAFRTELGFRCGGDFTGRILYVMTEAQRRRKRYLREHRATKESTWFCTNCGQRHPLGERCMAQPESELIKLNRQVGELQARAGNLGIKI